eukprot:364376-Chlamydomonas_euryale.AAC.6
MPLPVPVATGACLDKEGSGKGATGAAVTLWRSRKVHTAEAAWALWQRRWTRATRQAVPGSIGRGARWVGCARTWQTQVGIRT